MYVICPFLSSADETDLNNVFVCAASVANLGRKNTLVKRNNSSLSVELTNFYPLLHHKLLFFSLSFIL